MQMQKAKEHARDAFNRRAEGYEATLAGWHSDKMKKAALACLRPPVSGSLLDVGCGPGLFLATLAGQYRDLNLAGLDIAPEMIRVATQRLGTKADLKLGDAESLPWGDSTFDYVTCVDSFHHYPNPERALQEIHRVLRRDGCFVLADPTAPALVRRPLNSVIHLLRRGDVRMYDRKEITGMLEAVRFKPVDWREVGCWGFVASAVAR